MKISSFRSSSTSKLKIAKKLIEEEEERLKLEQELMAKDEIKVEEEEEEEIKEVDPDKE